MGCSFHLPHFFLFIVIFELDGVRRGGGGGLGLGWIGIGIGFGVGGLYGVGGGLGFRFGVVGGERQSN